MKDLLLEKRLIPEVLIRRHIRQLLRQRIDEETLILKEKGESYKKFVRSLFSSGPIAIDTAAANEQHYEMPARFFELVLGKHLKYSSGLWDHAATLDQAEEDMLKLTCARAELSDGLKILELGCGWGSLTLYMALKYPAAQVTAVSNSASQAAFIRKKASEASLSNIHVITCDINELDFTERFDRIVSVEMFEHMRNYDALLSKVSTWLDDHGKAFVHIFTHKDLAYKFDVVDESDWMAKYFFSGGIMPSEWLLEQFPDRLKVKECWRNNGTHYGKTAESWLKNMKANKQDILTIFKNVYPGNELKWFAYWKIFFMSCAELWNYNNGNEWLVSHYLLEK